jgi:hypothetical protein
MTIAATDTGSIVLSSLCDPEDLRALSDADRGVWCREVRAGWRGYVLS